MKLVLVSDSGTVLGGIEDVDEYNLANAIARADLLAAIVEMMDSANDEANE